jgi:hypothetical protein
MQDARVNPDIWIIHVHLRVEFVETRGQLVYSILVFFREWTAMLPTLNRSQLLGNSFRIAFYRTG